MRFLRTSLIYLGRRLLTPKSFNFGSLIKYSVPTTTKCINTRKLDINYRKMSVSTESIGIIEGNITTKLVDELVPTHIVGTNESYKHNVPKDSETHFHVLIVSDSFLDCKGLIHRHRLVNKILAYELANGVHALSITAKTTQEYTKMMGNNAEAGTGTPNCINK